MCTGQRNEQSAGEGGDRGGEVSGKVERNGACEDADFAGDETEIERSVHVRTVTHLAQWCNRWHDGTVTYRRTIARDDPDHRDARVRAAIRKNGADRKAAAEALGVSRWTLRRWLAELRIEPLPVGRRRKA